MLKILSAFWLVFMRQYICTRMTTRFQHFPQCGSDGLMDYWIDGWMDGLMAFIWNSGASSSLSFGKVKQKTLTIKVKRSYKD